jgi:uncharacterized membrane protein
VKKKGIGYMITPDFRTIEPVNISAPMETFVKFNYGDGMWTDVQGEISEVEKLHNNLHQVRTNKQNVVQLELF